MKDLPKITFGFIIVESASKKAVAISTPDGTLETLYRFKTEEDQKMFL